jgi:hypothetical protein
MGVPAMEFLRQGVSLRHTKAASTPRLTFGLMGGAFAPLVPAFSWGLPQCDQRSPLVISARVVEHHSGVGGTHHRCLEAGGALVNHSEEVSLRAHAFCRCR